MKINISRITKVDGSDTSYRPRKFITCVWSIVCICLTIKYVIKVTKL